MALRWLAFIRTKLHELLMWGHRLRHRRRKSWPEIQLLFLLVLIGYRLNWKA
jgi:hypothetical protein